MKTRDFNNRENKKTRDSKTLTKQAESDEQDYETPMESFEASRSWLQNFLRRANYRRSRVTSSGRALPCNYVEIIDSCMMSCN